MGNASGNARMHQLCCCRKMSGILPRIRAATRLHVTCNKRRHFGTSPGPRYLLKRCFDWKLQSYPRCYSGLTNKRSIPFLRTCRDSSLCLDGIWDVGQTFKVVRVFVLTCILASNFSLRDTTHEERERGGKKTLYVISTTLKCRFSVV